MRCQQIRQTCKIEVAQPTFNVCQKVFVSVDHHQLLQRILQRFVLFLPEFTYTRTWQQPKSLLAVRMDDDTENDVHSCRYHGRNTAVICSHVWNKPFWRGKTGPAFTYLTLARAFLSIPFSFVPWHCHKSYCDHPCYPCHQLIISSPV